MCDVQSYDDITCILDTDSDNDVWQMDPTVEEFHWAMLEVWGNALPDTQRLNEWHTSHLKYTDVFNTRTLFREFGVRGNGTLYVNTDDWRLLAESAHQYADMHRLKLENVTCCMAQWFLN